MTNYLRLVHKVVKRSNDDAEEEQSHGIGRGSDGRSEWFVIQCPGAIYNKVCFKKAGE